MLLAGDGLSGAQQEITLSPVREALGPASSIGKRFPFLTGCTALKLPSSITSEISKVSLQPLTCEDNTLREDSTSPRGRILLCACLLGIWQLISAGDLAQLHLLMQITELLRAQLAVSAEEEDGMPVDATGRLYALVRRNHSHTSVL